MRKFYVEHYRYDIKDKQGYPKEGMQFGPDELYAVINYVRGKAGTGNFSITKDLPFDYKIWRTYARIGWLPLEAWNSLLEWFKNKYDVVVCFPEMRF